MTSPGASDPVDWNAAWPIASLNLHLEYDPMPNDPLDEVGGSAPTEAGSTSDRPLGIVWWIAVDPVASDEVVIYAGAHDHGIAVLPFRDLDSGPAVDLGFDPTAQQRIETPGKPFSVRVRPSSPGVEKALLVSDGIGGLRLYVTE